VPVYILLLLLSLSASYIYNAPYLLSGGQCCLACTYAFLLRHYYSIHHLLILSSNVVTSWMGEGTSLDDDSVGWFDGRVRLAAGRGGFRTTYGRTGDGCRV